MALLPDWLVCCSVQPLDIKSKIRSSGGVSCEQSLKGLLRVILETFLTADRLLLDLISADDVDLTHDLLLLEAVTVWLTVIK